MVSAVASSSFYGVFSSKKIRLNYKDRLEQSAILRQKRDYDS